jgi:hypothetical protein
MAPRRWRSHISRAPLGFCGQKPRLASALVGGLLANFIAGSAWFCVLRIEVKIQRKTQASSPQEVFINKRTKVFNKRLVRYAAINKKKL